MKISKYYVFILCSFLLLGDLDAFSQTNSGNPAGAASVDRSIGALSAGYQRAKARGMGDNEFAALARQNGFKEADIQSVIKAGGGNASPEGSSSVIGRLGNPAPSSSDLRQMVQLGGEDIYSSGDSSLSVSAYEKKIFGYEVFNNKQVNFTPNLNMATPRDYIVGPGDQLVIQIYGIAQGSFTLPVSPEGKINIPNVGVVHVGSLSIDAAKAAIQQKLATRYPGIGGSNPATFVMVTIGNIRSIKVNMVGELKNPGTYQLPSFSSVFNALYLAGGPSVKGSFRKVQVFRANRLLTEIDLYEFLTKGVTRKNIRLEDNDVILVPAYTQRIELKGEVRREGLYEPLLTESLNQIITIAGGFTERAYQKNVSVQRLTDQEQQLLTVEQNQFNQFNFRDGDIVVFGEILERFANRVQVIGAINHSGDYELKTGMRLKDLIIQAGGLKADALLERATLYRSSPSLEQQVLPIDLVKVMEGDPEYNVILQREDYLSISSIYDSRSLFYVKLEGEVNNTGVFPYAENMTVKDLILKAGGFKEAASATGIEVVRRSPNDPNSIATVIKLDIDKNYLIDGQSQSIKLEPFDMVFVRTLAELRPYQYAYVNGEAKRTGQFVLDKPVVYVSELLERAGGAAISGDLKGAVLLRRTIFYKDASLDEQYLSELREIRAKVSDSTALGNTEPNKVLLTRIDKEIERVESERNLNQSGVQDNRDIFGPGTIANNTSSNDERQANNKLREELQNIKELRNDLQVKMIRGLNNVTINENKYEFVSINLDRIADEQSKSIYDIRLKDGDILYIPPFDETVRVGGEVLYPVAVKFTGNNSFRSYINNAGGFRSEALRKRSYLIESNGAVHSTRNFLGLIKFYPRVTAGSQIIVPKDTKVKTFSVDRLFGLVASLVTTYLLITNLSN
jgi:protein involved in polysaccharide export with SLBB domain